VLIQQFFSSMRLGGVVINFRIQFFSQKFRQFSVQMVCYGGYGDEINGVVGLAERVTAADR
jgi:hypothetical protein